MVARGEGHVFRESAIRPKGAGSQYPHIFGDFLHTPTQYDTHAPNFAW